LTSSKGFLWTSLLLLSLALLYAAHTAVAAVLSDQIKRPYISVVANLINALVICGFLVYCASRVRRGKRLGLTCGMLCYLTFQATIVAAIFLRDHASIPPSALTIQALYVLNLVALWWALTTTWIRSQAASDRPAVDRNEDAANR
jgi:hypothetical protein